MQQRNDTEASARPPSTTAPGGATGNASAPERPVDRAEIAALAIIAILETLAIAVMTAFDAPASTFLAAHLLAIVALALVLARTMRLGRDVTVAMLGLSAGIVAGPLGPVGAILVGLTSGRSTRPSPLVQAWYDRISMSTAIDPDVRLCDDVGIGRTLDLGPGTPESYPSIMAHGPLVKRQSALGNIARKFHPAYLPTLKLALESPEPVLRVQAAAVAAHVGPAVRSRLRSCLLESKRALDAPTALDLLVELDCLVASGLLDEIERGQADEARAHLATASLAPLERGILPSGASGTAHAAALRDKALEQLLLGRGRFADLRAHRNARAIARRHPTARFRRLRISRANAEAAE